MNQLIQAGGMAATMTTLIIDNIDIHQDANGRYSLNDLHRAAGGEKRHGPSYWLTNAQTRALVEELATTGIPVVTVEGAGGGTYVARELVYAYAMWISPAFHLKVIRAYDAKVNQPATVATLPDFSNPAAAARAWAEQFEQREQLELENRAQANALALAAPKAEFVDRYVDSTGNKGFRQVAKLLKANEARFREFLEDEKIMYKLGGEWTPYQQHIDAGRFVVKTGVSESDHAYNHAKFTPKGVEWIAAQWAIHCLRGSDEQEAA
ncbi:phage antirepressor KilAC domain-containing protein [Achromobacter xylosoxidans]|jgi:phage antirepressor YoqD-like protein